MIHRPSMYFPNLDRARPILAKIMARISIQKPRGEGKEEANQLLATISQITTKEMQVEATAKREDLITTVITVRNRVTASVGVLEYMAFLRIGIRDSLETHLLHKRVQETTQKGLKC